MRRHLAQVQVGPQPGGAKGSTAAGEAAFGRSLRGRTRARGVRGLGVRTLSSSGSKPATLAVPRPARLARPVRAVSPARLRPKSATASDTSVPSGRRIFSETRRLLELPLERRVSCMDMRTVGFFCPSPELRSLSPARSEAMPLPR